MEFLSSGRTHATPTTSRGAHCLRRHQRRQRARSRRSIRYVRPAGALPALPRTHSTTTLLAALAAQAPTLQCSDGWQELSHIYVRARRASRLQAARVGASGVWLVAATGLQGLWKKLFDAAQVNPERMLPSGGQAGAVQPKLKRSREHQLEHNLFIKQRRKCSREAREVEEAERSLANESKRMQKRTTFACDFADAGCRQRPFLSKSGAVAHSRSCMYSGLGERRPDECRVKLRVRVSSRVQVSLRAQRSGVKVQLRSAFAHTTSILKVERPQQPAKPYGKQPHSALVHHRTQEARSSAARTVVSRHVCVSLTVGTHGRVRLSMQLHRGSADHRGLPELLGLGWEVRPPKVCTRFTHEQRAFLTKLFDWPAGRLNEQQAYLLFRKQFSSKDGQYARSLRLSRAQIKAWFSTEKAKRLKAGATAAAEATDQADEHHSPAAAPSGAPASGAPASDVPASGAPASSTLASSAPASSAPASSAPVSGAPASSAPASSAPASGAPASSARSAPASGAPASSAPESSGPASDAPASSGPASDAPASGAVGGVPASNMDSMCLLAPDPQRHLGSRSHRCEVRWSVLDIARTTSML